MEDKKQTKKLKFIQIQKKFKHKQNQKGQTYFKKVKMNKDDEPNRRRRGKRMRGENASLAKEDSDEDSVCEREKHKRFSVDES